MIVLGIDAGGTKTVCQAASADGVLLAEARAAGANLQAAGELGVEKVLHEVVSDVRRTIGKMPAAVCLGMAGVDRAADAALVQGILNRLVHGTPTLVVNDALIALEAGVPGQPGVVVIAGTGSIAYGRDDQHRAARAGGWGYVLGDEGSGYWLGRLALRAVVRAADGRGPATTLAVRILDHYQVRRAQDLVREIYYGGLQPSSIAALAAQVQAAAAEGDDVARHLISTGASELASAAAAVSRQLSLPRGPVILAGGIFRAVPLLREEVTARVAERLPDATTVPLTVEPAAGAIRLAIACASGTFVMPTYVDAPRD